MAPHSAPTYETSLGLIALESDIPADHPRKQAIEDSIREAFKGVSGSWLVGVLLVMGAPWWVVFVHDVRNGMKRSALLDSEWKQHPQAVTDIILNLMRELGSVSGSHGGSA